MDLLQKHYFLTTHDPQESYDAGNARLLKDFMFLCHKKCLNFRNPQLNPSERECLKNCASKFHTGYLKMTPFKDS
jgi:hypothetical protein